MAEPLKNHFGKDIPAYLAQQIHKIFPNFPTQNFLRDALHTFNDLELLARGKHLAKTLHQYLPSHYPTALKILLESIHVPSQRNTTSNIASFYYLPHTDFIRLYGLDHPHESLHAMQILTPHFTAEFCIRPYLIHHLKITLQYLNEWVKDPDPHLRRLVSEGTRPRLPWAPRLPYFQQNPTAPLKLLNQIKDDPSLYVRKSVANHLNDIGKDHPDQLIKTCQAWSKNTTPHRQWIIRHALRNLIKQGHPQALALIGYYTHTPIQISKSQISPKKISLGQTIQFTFTLTNPTPKPQKNLIDYIIYYKKANQQNTPKVFKLKEIIIPPNTDIQISKAISFIPLTTRKYHIGQHSISLLLNGVEHQMGHFTLQLTTH
jgi:3-methyladenine DNA glycosylase AlkC